VLRPLIEGSTPTPSSPPSPDTREEEAVGIATGAIWPHEVHRADADLRLRTLPNALASLCVAFQVPVVMMVSDAARSASSNPGQAIVFRTMRPILDSMVIEHHTMPPRRAQFIADRTIRQPFATRWPACLSSRRC